MKEKMWHWYTAEKMKLLFTIMLMFVLLINIFVLKRTFFVESEKYVYTSFLFCGSILFICILLLVEYIKSRKISKVYLVAINAISMANFLLSDGVTFNTGYLIFRAVLFMVVVVVGLVVVWIAKKHFKKHFVGYLILSLWTVVLNFGGFYEALYSISFPYGQESFKIDQNMSWSQVVMPVDFIYYSADAFFGTDISDVSIKYLDYMELLNEDSIVTKHVDKYDIAIQTIQIAKMFSVIESVLFIVYISIIVMSAENVKEEADTYHYEKEYPLCWNCIVLRKK